MPLPLLIRLRPCTAATEFDLDLAVIIDVVVAFSIPEASLKPVSAMKGGRAQKGSSSKMELHVKWAPEVYDPPCTSVSHTVNGHRQRSKAKKKDNRKNKNKGKSPRGSEKKNTNHKHATNAGAHVNGHKVLLDGYMASHRFLTLLAAQKKSVQPGRCFPKCVFQLASPRKVVPSANICMA